MMIDEHMYNAAEEQRTNSTLSIAAAFLGINKYSVEFYLAIGGGCSVFGCDAELYDCNSDQGKFTPDMSWYVHTHAPITGIADTLSRHPTHINSNLRIVRTPQGHSPSHSISSSPQLFKVLVQAGPPLPVLSSR
jgi:hypothetical protein